MVEIISTDSMNHTCKRIDLSPAADQCIHSKLPKFKDTPDICCDEYKNQIKVDFTTEQCFKMMLTELQTEDPDQTSPPGAV